MTTNEENLQIAKDLRGMIEAGWRELSIAETVLAEFNDAQDAVCTHLVKGYGYAAQFIDRVDPLSGDNAVPLLERFFAAAPSAIRHKDSSRWLESSKTLLAASSVPRLTNLDSFPLSWEELSDHCRWLRQILSNYEKRFRRDLKTIYKVQLYANPWKVGGYVLVILLACYVALSLWRGSFSPSYWLAVDNGQFRVMSTRQDWGAMRYDRSVDGRPFSIAGKRYERGLGTHANSNIVLLIPASRKAKLLEGACGVDDEVGSQGSIICRIQAEGKVLFETSTLRGGMPAAAFSVPVSGLEKVELVILQADNGRAFDHADWVDLSLK